ncbi:MAG: putative Ig domain-containing protein, partial [Thermoplasmata archaeon]
LLVSPSVVLSTPDDDSEDRASWTVNDFIEGKTPVAVSFEESSENSTYHLSVPNSALITHANMVIEGVERPELVGTVYDFRDNTSTYGWEGYTKSYPPAGSPSTLGGTPFSDLAYQEVARLDGTTRMTSTSWQNNPPPHEYPFHLLNIKVNMTDAVRLKLEWHGYGRCDGNDSNDHGAELWVWNYTSTEWEKLRSYAGNDTGDTIQTLSYVIRDIDHYSDRFGNVYMLAFGMRDEKGPIRPELGSIGTDYAAVSVMKNGSLQQPVDVAVAIGDDDAFWSHSGPFTTRVTLSDTEGLKAAIQAYVASVPPSMVNLSVPFVFSVGRATFAEVRVLSISVGVQEYDNQAPEFLGARTVTMTEDEELLQGLDLRDHFTDDLQGSDLTYTVEYMENASLVLADIHVDGYSVNFYPVESDYAGTLTFRFAATDGWDMTTVSGDFCVTVEEVNDAPRLYSPGDLILDEDVPFGLNVSYWDPDVRYGDVLTFSDDTELFDIDPDTGRIEVTPRQADTGTYDVTITVTDSHGLKDDITFVVTVIDVNDGPIIEDPGVLMAEEDALLDHKFSVWDEDGDSDFTWVLVGGVGTMKLGRYDGRLTWIPEGEHVGLTNVSVIATDVRGASDQVNISIHVVNVNDPPVLDVPRPSQTVEGQRFTYSVLFTDPDLEEDPEEEHTFSVDPPLFPILPGGVVDFTPTNADVGTHTLTLTVTDRAGASDSLEWEVTVANVNEPPTLQPVEDQIWKEDEPVLLAMIASDPDLHDVLTFTDSTSVFDIHPSTGEINFTPLEMNVGRHQVRIVVTDSGGLYADIYFEVTIQAYNDPPTASIRVVTVDDVLEEGDQLSLAAEVEDPDNINLDFSYFWYVNGKERGNDPTLVLNDLKPGVHHVELRVNDGDNDATATYQFSVKEVDDPFPWAWVIGAIVAALVVAVLGLRSFKALQDTGGGKEAVVPEPEPEEPEPSIYDEDGTFEGWGRR